jgi:surfactin family lipopeptide synthetase A
MNISYEDERLETPDHHKSRDYWLNKLSGDIVKSHIPYDSIVSMGERTPKKEAIAFKIPLETGAKLLEICGDSDYRLHMMLTAVLNVLVNRYNGNKDIIIGTPVFKKGDYVELTNSILAIRNMLDPEMTFKDLVIAVKQTVMDGVEHQNYPFETLLSKLKMDDYANGFSLFDIIIILRNIQNEELIKDFFWNLLFSFERNGEVIDGAIKYNSAVYQRATIERIITHYQNLLISAVDNVNLKIKALNMISEKERKRILYEFNDKKVDFPKEYTIHHLVERNAEAYGEKTAVLDRNQRISYRELNQKANRLARKLKANGVARDRFAAIAMDRSIGMVISILATWKAGGAYIPVDLSYPGERIRYILENSRPEVLLTQSGEMEFKYQDYFNGKVINVESCEIAEYDSANLNDYVDINDLAYVIYTSGSTGNPKGAMIEHLGMMNHIYAKINELGITEDSIIAQNASYCFDISVWQFFAALTTGGTTVIYPDDTVLEPGKLLTGIIKNKITIMEVVPSYLAAMLDNLDEEPKRLEDVEYLVVTGEELKSELVGRWFGKYQTIKLVNAYGPTEAADDITHYIMSQTPKTGKISIGRPLPNLNIYIVDENMNLCPVSVKGEICVSGIGVGRGYLNDREKTGSVFLEDPFSGEAGVRLYKTGDFGRWMADGCLDFMGRKDFQVKIRGFRIETGEIEKRLLEHPKVKEAVVIDKANSGREAYLCAYSVLYEDVAVAELKDFLSNRLPAYMIPAYFIKLPKLPLNSNGKLDRKSLPEPDDILSDHNLYEAARNRTDQALADIWNNILNLEKVGINENFFDIGGHSLKATLLAARIHKEFKKTIPLDIIFKSPTIKQISDYIDNCRNDDRYINIGPVEQRAYYPLSSSQKRMYFLQEVARDSTGYNIPQFLFINEKVDIGKINRVFKQLLERHESLRTLFCIADGELVQKIVDDLDFTVDYLALMKSGNPNRDEMLKQVTKDFIKPFDLSKAPIFRACLVQIDDNTSMLMVDTHHIISDGISQEVLIRDFMGLYENKKPQPLKLQYKDYAVWQNSEAYAEMLKIQENFWLDLFSESIPALDLPLDFARDDLGNARGAVVNVDIAKREANLLGIISKNSGASLFMTLFAIFNMVVAKITGNDDLVIGVPVAGRRHADLQNIVGMFVNMLPLRNRLHPGQSFIGFLKELMKNTLQAFENQEFQFEDLVSKLRLNREYGRNPLFDIVFVFQNRNEMEAEFGEKFGFYQTDYQAAKFDLVLEAVETDEGISLSFQYNKGLFKAQTIKAISEYLLSMIRELVDEPDKKFADLKFASNLSKRDGMERSIAGNMQNPDGKARILADFNI